MNSFDGSSPASTDMPIPYHPSYSATFDEMMKWRYTFEGGDTFRDQYLKIISSKETLDNFNLRKSLTPIGGFAAEGIIKIRDTLFQHFSQIRRIGGPESYQRAIQGVDVGVDLKGNSMDTFLGTQVALELILMGKVGVFVDMPELRGPTKADNLGRRPYLYFYPRENVLNWVPDTDPNSNEFQSVFLQDYIFGYDGWGFPIADVKRKRRIFKDPEDGFIYEQVWDDKRGFRDTPKKRLGITRVPFVFLEITDSLMRRVADHQIAIMNIESLDINHLMKSNFNFYVEENVKNPDTDPTKKVIVAGPDAGRRYPAGAKPPQFINPSSETMKASIDKQEQLKIDIRRLLDLALTMIQQNTGKEAQGKINPKVTGTGSGVETGLSNIGLTLETGEQKIASFWGEYEETPGAYVAYPKTYTFKSDAQRAEEAEKLSDMIDCTPSKTFQRAIAKEIVEIMLSGKADADVIKKCKSEIDDAEIVQTDCDTINKDVASGLVAPEDASIARGYPKDSVKRAQEAQAQRAAAIVVAQTKGAGHAANAQLLNPSARGAPDLNPAKDNVQQASKEKADAKANKKQRGNRNPNPGGNQADKN